MTFSLRSLLGAVVFAATVAFALCGQPRAGVGIAFCFVTLLIPAILTAGIVNGDQQSSAVIGTGWIMMAIMGTLSVLCGRLFWPEPPA